MTDRTGVFIAAVRRETRQLLTSPWDAFVAFGLPLILLIVVAAMLLEGVIQKTPVAVVDHDNSAFSRAAIRNMQASSGIDVVYTPATVDDAMALMRRGEIYTVAYFPSGFTQGAFNQPEQVVVYFNGALQTVGALAAASQTAAITAAAAPMIEMRARQLGLPATSLEPPAVQVSIIGNPQFNFELFLGALLAPGVLHILAASSAVLAIGRLMEGGSFAAFKKSVDGHTTSGMLGHLTPHLVIFSLWGLAWTAWLCGYREWGFSGSMLLAVMGVVALMAVSVALSALLVSVLGDIDVAFSGTAIYAGAAIAFSTGTLPLHDGPVFARTWSDILPYTHYLRLQTGQLVTEGTALFALHDLAILFGMTGVALVISAIMIKVRGKRVPNHKHASFPLPVRGIWASFKATFVHLPCSWPVASLLVLAVLLYAFYYPAAYAGQTAAHLPLAIVAPEPSRLTRELTEDLNSTFAAQVVSITPSATQAMDMMRDGKVDGVIIIPRNFEEGIARGTPEGIALWLNGGYLVRATSIAEAVGTSVSNVLRARLEGLPEAIRAVELAPTLQMISMFNPTEGYGNYAVPAVSLIILQQTLLLGSAVLTAIRRESHAAPIRMSSRIGLWLAMTTIGTASCLFYFGFVFWFHDYPRGGNILGILLLSPIYAASISALGLAIGGFFDRPERILQVLVATSAPLFFLAGSAWPHYMMPEVMVWLAHLSPSTPGVEAFVRMNAMGATLSEVGTSSLLLIALTAVYGAFWLFVKHPGVSAPSPNTLDLSTQHTSTDKTKPPAP